MLYRTSDGQLLTVNRLDFTTDVAYNNHIMELHRYQEKMSLFSKLEPPTSLGSLQKISKIVPGICSVTYSAKE